MFRWLINLGLLGLPIAVTLGILFGIQTHRVATGQSPLFVDNGVSKDQYCQRSYGIHPKSKGQEYTLNPNQWGWKEGEPGQLCMNVTSHNNRTYATANSAPKFSVTWLYPQGPESQPVHAFPNIKLEGDTFPLSLGDVSKIQVDLEWTYGVGNKTVTTTDESDLKKHELNANVAIDMFLDSDKTAAQDSEKAKYEIMIWLAMFGASAQPIGYNDPVVAKKTLNGTTFSLYSGKNSNGQFVLTWLPEKAVEKLHADISPLIEEIVTLKLDSFPGTSTYLGYMGMGTEAYYADSAVTFTVPQLSMEVKRKTSTTA